MKKKEKKSVCIVFPRYILHNYGPPLGALYICSVLKEKGYHVTFIDGTVTSYEKTIEQLKQNKPDILNLSIQTVFADFAFQLAKDYRKINRNAIIIAGGPHASILPKQTLAEKGIDFVVVGEGEETLPDLLSNIKDPKKVKGIGFRKNNKHFFTESREPIKDLDKIPFPARDMLHDNYFRTGSTSIITSRGCPFNCAFCQPTLRKIFGPKFRMRTVKNVIDEIKDIKKTFMKKNRELKSLHFTDDGLTYNHKWLKNLGQEIIKQKLDITWTANTRADTMPEIGLLRLLKKSGLTKFSIGVESGDPYIRNEILKKNVSQEKLIKAFDLCHEAGIKTHAYLMVGSPEETHESILATVKLLDRIRPDDTQVTITSPLPETYLYYHAKEKDIMKVKRWSDFAYYEESHLELKNFTKDDIKKLQKAIHYTIFLHRNMKKRGIDTRYSSLFSILKNPIVNTSLRGLDKARLHAKKALRR
ncbi:MAG: radical SAM protein [archaeon]